MPEGEDRIAVYAAVYGHQVVATGGSIPFVVQSGLDRNMFTLKELAEGHVQIWSLEGTASFTVTAE